MPPKPSRDPGLTHPREWIMFEDGDTKFYADPFLTRDRTANKIADIFNPFWARDFYHAHTIQNELEFRPPTDREYNIMVNGNPEIAEQMDTFNIWTSILKNVELTKNGYTALYIARPVVRKAGNDYEITGSEQRVKLPPGGNRCIFKISELLESENGLPEKTYETHGCSPDEPRARYYVNTGELMAIQRGNWRRPNEAPGREFGFITIRPIDPEIIGATRAVSDENPVEVIRKSLLDCIGELKRRYGVINTLIGSRLGAYMELYGFENIDEVRELVKDAL